MSNERLKILREVGQQLLANRKMDFGFALWDCGTYACFMGHYDRATGEEVVVKWRASIRNREFEYGTCWDFMGEYFGITESEAKSLFIGSEVGGCPVKARMPSPEAYEELGQRMIILDGLIADREPKVKTSIHPFVQKLLEQTSRCPAEAIDGVQL